MSRLNKEMHSLLTEEVLELLFSKNIYTVLDFIEADTKQLSNIMRFAMKAFEILNYCTFLLSAVFVGCFSFEKLHNK